MTDHAPDRFATEAVLKEDLFGSVERGTFVDASGTQRPAVRRNLRTSPWWARPLARRLASREARVLRMAADVARIPKLLHQDRRSLVRTWVAGQPLNEQPPPSPAYFETARAILDDLHALGITHNDLHKEPNLLVTTEGDAAIVDFQLASVFRRRKRWYDLYVREDIRHLLKHKRRYFRETITDEDRIILSTPSWIARWWRLTGKRVYIFVTRRILRWRDREGRGMAKP